MRKARREFRLTKEEMALIILAGEMYESDSDFLDKYGFDPKDWPHRGILIKLNHHWSTKWATWDHRQGWLRW